MKDPNITIEEYAKIKEEKARRRNKVYNWETATHGKIRYDDVYDLKSVETKFPAIVFNGKLTSKEALSCEPMPTVNYFDDLDFLKDFENEFPAIVYNDDLTSKSDQSTEPVKIPHRIDEFDLKTKTSSSECDEEEQNVLYFNDLFPFNIIYPDDLKSDKDNDNDKIDIKHSSRGNVINTDVGACAHGSNKLLETSHDTSNKFFKTKTFIKELNVNIMVAAKSLALLLLVDFLLGLLLRVERRFFLYANLPEDEPVQSEHAPIMLGFAPAMLNIQNNNNGWIEEDDEEEIEAEEDDEEEIEAEDDNEMDVKVDDDENDAEIIHPYEEADPQLPIECSCWSEHLITFWFWLDHEI
ncbi:hypothetical protein Tco_0223106 [Tanacetum coccineum]